MNDIKVVFFDALIKPMMLNKQVSNIVDGYRKRRSSI